MTQQKIISSYLKRVKRNCPFSFRKNLTADLKNHLLEYFNDNPGSTLEDIINHLGAPEKYADEYLLVIDTTTRKRVIHKTKLIKYSILSGIAAIVLIIAVTAVMILFKISQVRVYYYEEYVTDDITIQ
mgnify:CR=1 FL=1